MRNVSRTLAVLLAPLVAALTAGAAHADDTVVAALERLAAPGSDGGTTITHAEVAGFTATVPATLSGDEAVLGLVIAGRLRREVPIADADYGALAGALRRRTEGLGVSLLQAPGVRFDRAGAGNPLVVRFDAAGVDFTRVDLIFTWDDWATTRAVTLAPAARAWRATVPGAPATGRLRYALHVFGRDGGDYWFNYGVESGVGGGNAHLDYTLDLAATSVEAAPTSAPVLAKLVQTFKHPSSPGGSAIDPAELDLLVETVTWEGGPGIQDDAVIDPAIAMVATLVEDGNDFTVDDALLTGFLDRQRLRFGQLPGIDFVRDPDGRLKVRVWAQPGVAELFWSTDGWNLPHSQVCTPGPDGAVCDLGYLPRGAILAYTLKVTDRGQVTWNYVDRGLGRPSNFFHRIP